jgi:hypothetical protein
LILQILLKIRSRVKIRASNDDEAVKHVAVEATLLLLPVLTVSQPVLVLNGPDGMTKLGLILANYVDSGLKVIELDRSISISGYHDCPSSI